MIYFIATSDPDTAISYEGGDGQPHPIPMQGIPQLEQAELKFESYRIDRQVEAKDGRAVGLSAEEMAAAEAVARGLGFELRPTYWTVTESEAKMKQKSAGTRD